MKKILLTYLVLFVYLITLIKPMLPVIDYAVNYDYIAKVLCINKDKPKSTCHGKCHVAKEIENNKTNQQKKIQLNDLEFDKYVKNTTPSFKLLFTSYKKQVLYYNELEYTNYYKKIFRPPISSKTV